MRIRSFCLTVLLLCFFLCIHIYDAMAAEVDSGKSLSFRLGVNTFSNMKLSGTKGETFNISQNLYSSSMQVLAIYPLKYITPQFDIRLSGKTSTKHATGFSALIDYPNQEFRSSKVTYFHARTFLRFGENITRNLNFYYSPGFSYSRFQASLEVFDRPLTENVNIIDESKNFIGPALNLETDYSLPISKGEHYGTSMFFSSSYCIVLSQETFHTVDSELGVRIRPTEKKSGKNGYGTFYIYFTYDTNSIFRDYTIGVGLGGAFDSSR